MDNEKIGRLIFSLRTEKHLTQRELAERLAVGDKAVSKWERGQGCPDVSLLPALAGELGIGVEQLLSGSPPASAGQGGNLKELRFYVCPVCGEIAAGTGSCEIICCGVPTAPLKAKAPDGDHAVSVETSEDEWLVTSRHPMEKAHHIAFVALITGERTEIVRSYAEWELHARFFKRGHGRLFWFCTRHGLFTERV